MLLRRIYPPEFDPRLAEAIIDIVEYAQALMARKSRQPAAAKAKKSASRPTGRTLRPGRGTPLWNELRRQVRSRLRRRGDQAKLGRLLGLPRQRINAFVTGGGEMPDAERTLQLLAWLMAVRAGQKPD